MKYLMIPIFCLLMFAGGVPWARARALEPVAISLATITGFEPFVYQENGKARGIDVDIIMEMCQRAGLTCHLEFHPWMRVLAQIEGGHTAGGFTAFRTPEREAFADFLPQPLHFSTYSLFVKVGQEFDYSSLTDLYGKTVGVERGFAISPAFEQAAAKGLIQVQETDSLEQNLRKLLAGQRIDAVIGNYHKMRIKVREMKLSCEISCLPVPVVPPRPAHLIMSKKWAHPRKKEILEQMVQHLNAMAADGTIDRIDAAYLE